MNQIEKSSKKLFAIGQIGLAIDLILLAALYGKELGCGLGLN